MTNKNNKKVVLKEMLYNSCCDFVNYRVNSIYSTIKDLQEALSSETKSSAGDKHETGRSMIQLELEKLANQQKETSKLQETLSKMDIVKLSKVVSLGSLVYTNQLNYFIGISCGKIEFENEAFYAISPDSPIGQLLMGKKIADEIKFRNQRITIKIIF